MPCLLAGLPGVAFIQQAFQLDQVVHAKAMKVTPARYAEQVIDDHGGVSFAGQALVPAELLGSGFGFVPVVVGVEQFHRCLVVVQQAGDSA